jgi:AcrR family transcriptional regulator
LPNGGTAHRILDHARRAFNERGVAAVGMREIARELDISPGNLSYHFATKEALLAALVVRMHEDNNALVAEPTGALDLAGVDALLRALMRRDYENRWLMRDCVGLVQSMPSLARLLAPMQRARDARVDVLARRLVGAGLLDAERTKHALPLLRTQLVTQVAFWLPAAILAEPKRDPIERLDIHARAALALFLPLCTPTGKRQLQRVLVR